MRRDLFRNEVRKNGKETWLGEVRVVSPISHKVWAASAAILFVILIAWLILGSYTRRERVGGYLVPIHGSSTVRARTASEVAEVYVRVGQGVETGEPILKFGTDRSLGKAGLLHLEEINITMQQLRDIEAELAFVAQSRGEQLSQVDDQVSLVKRQIAMGEQELGLSIQESDATRDVLKGIEKLIDDKYISLVQLRQYQSAASQAAAAVLRQQSAMAQLRGQEVELKATRARLSAEMATRTSTLVSRRADLRKALNQSQADSSGYLYSPMAGVVANINVSPGQAINAGRLVATIVPKNATLEVELLVPSTAIGFVKVGSPVAVRYSAFPSQKYGTHSANVREISSSPLSPAEVTELTGQTGTQVSMYRVRASLSNQSPISSQRLLPGMAVEVDLMQERRQMYEWIVEPIASLKSALGDPK